MLKRPVLSATFATVLVVAACEEGPRTVQPPTFTVRDSAGIEIVENHAPRHPAGSFWTIDPDPEIVLGRAGEPGGGANDPSRLVWRVVGLARLPDGRVAVLSSGSRQLMLFEPSGRLSRTIGGPGEGPGEFTHPLRLQYLPPDTLVVWDQFLSSIAYFDAGGTLLRERTIDLARLSEHGPLAESLRLPVPDGSFLVGLPVTTDGESADDCARLAVRGLSVTLRGSPFRQENLIVPGEALLRIDDDYAAHSFGCAKGFGTHLAVGGDPPMVYVSNDGKEIQQRSLDGTLVRIIRRTTEPPRVTDRAWKAEEEHLAILGWSSATEEGPEIRRREKYDAIESILVGAEGIPLGEGVVFVAVRDTGPVECLQSGGALAGIPALSSGSGGTGSAAVWPALHPLPGGEGPLPGSQAG